MCPPYRVVCTLGIVFEILMSCYVSGIAKIKVTVKAVPYLVVGSGTHPPGTVGIDIAGELKIEKIVNIKIIASILQKVAPAALLAILWDNNPR